MKKKDKRDIILILDGGSLRGIFGNGVITALQKANMYSRIHSIYGRSAGAHNAAFFISRRSVLGSTIYTDDLTTGKFIRTKRFIKFAGDMLLRIFIKKKRVETILDIDFARQIESKKKKIDVKRVSKSPIKFYVKVFDIKERKSVYIDARKDVLKAVEASSAVIPFYPHAVLSDGKKYADGNTIEGELVADKIFFDLAKKHKDKKIILAINAPLTPLVIARNIIFNFIWAILLGIFISPSVFFKKCMYLFRYDLTRKFLKYPNVYLLANESIRSSVCTDRNKLLDVYHLGIIRTQELLKRL